MHRLQREFKYSRLKRDEIRLFSFKDEKNSSAADESRELECKVEHFPRGSAPKYYALSYAWGESKHMRSIKLNGKTFDVTKNLRDGLRELRRRGRGLLHLLQSELMLEEAGLYFWIDAICLNQSDLAEKSSQIPKMGPIFAEAFNVIVWLGKLDPEWDEMDLNCIQYLLHRLRSYNYGQRKLGEIVHPPASSSEWGPKEKRAALIWASKHILFTEWFDRVWVIQEFALAHRTPLALLGTYMFPLESIAHVLEMCPEYTATSDASAFPLEIYELVDALASEKHYEILLQELHAKHWTQNPALPFAAQLELMILKKQSRHCSLHHDFIYGVLGLVDQTEMPKELLPNYATPFLEVFETFSRYIYTRTGSLALLDNSARSNTEIEDPGCPSWVADFQPMVTLSSDYPPDHFQERLCFSSDGKTLSVDGVILGNILDSTSAVDSQHHTDTSELTEDARARKLALLKLRYVFTYFLSASAHRLGRSVESRWLELLNATEDSAGTQRSSRTPETILQECNDFDNGENRYVTTRIIADCFRDIGSVLVDNGDILRFWPIDRMIKPEDSIVVVLKGSVTYTVLRKIDDERYKCMAQAQKLDRFPVSHEPHGLGAEFFEGKELQRFDIV